MTPTSLTSYILKIFLNPTHPNSKTIHQVEKALDILRGVFPNEHEVIVQLQRLAHINREHRQGELTDAVYKVERTRLTKAILDMLREREDDI